jgi:hypothetical protein
MVLEGRSLQQSYCSRTVACLPTVTCLAVLAHRDRDQQQQATAAPGRRIGSPAGASPPPCVLWGGARCYLGGSWAFAFTLPLGGHSSSRSTEGRRRGRQRAAGETARGPKGQQQVRRGPTVPFPARRPAALGSPGCCTLDIMNQRRISEVQRSNDDWG